MSTLSDWLGFLGRPALCFERVGIFDFLPGKIKPSDPSKNREGSGTRIEKFLIANLIILSDLLWVVQRLLGLGPPAI